MTAKLRPIGAAPAGHSGRRLAGHGHPFPPISLPALASPVRHSIITLDVRDSQERCETWETDHLEGLPLICWPSTSRHSFLTEHDANPRSRPHAHAYAL
jgi:hypothetical protein